MSHKHKAKIEKLFEHPISGNIDVKRLLSALEHYGASVEMNKQNRAKIVVGGEELILALSHRNDLSIDSITKLRHFLEKVGITPDTL
ncbi:hypothetical protein KJ877_07240 [bacterium]|nr:hypothetical protein [bacterium]MBU1990534.1 hypothetical protein [bacterium]